MPVRHINHYLRQWLPLLRQLIRRREELGASQTQLAIRVGAVSRQTIGRIEAGDSVPGIDTVLALCEALDLEVAFVPPHLHRLLRLSQADMVAIIRAAAAATNAPLTLGSIHRDRTVEALHKISPRSDGAF